MHCQLADIFRAAAAVIGVFGLTGLNGEGAAAAVRAPLGSQSVPVFVFTSSTNPSIEEYVIDEFKKELAKRTKDFPFALVDSLEQARVVLQIGEITEFCGAFVSDAMIGTSATLRVGSFSAPITVSGACSPYKRFKYRPLGKKLAEGLAKWGKEHRADLAAPWEPVDGHFVSELGYQIEIPAEYRAYPAPLYPANREVEVVFFAPSGTELTADESQYAQRGIVRLEAWKETNVSFASWKETVSRSLDSRRETYAVRDLEIGRPSFLVHITSPREIRQLIVQGTDIMFMFTGADEAQLRVLARGIK